MIHHMPRGMTFTTQFVQLSLITLILVTACGPMPTDIMIENRSGVDVRFEKVMINDQIVWQKPNLTIRTYANREGFDPKGGEVIRVEFQGPKQIVELKLAVINEMNERESVSCALDNRERSPSFCRVDYFKNRLRCSSCGKVD